MTSYDQNAYACAPPSAAELDMLVRVRKERRAAPPLRALPMPLESFAYMPNEEDAQEYEHRAE